MDRENTWFEVFWWRDWLHGEDDFGEGVIFCVKHVASKKGEDDDLRSHFIKRNDCMDTYNVRFKTHQADMKQIWNPDCFFMWDPYFVAYFKKIPWKITA